MRWLSSALLVALAGCGAPRAAGPDAADSGASDAGSTDAGSTDAGDADGGATDAGPADGGAALSAGVLLFGQGKPLAGIAYESAGAHGYTDSTGKFEYAGALKLSIAGLELATIPGAAQLTPFALAGSCAASDELEKLLVFLESVGDPAPAFNGELAGVQLSQLTMAQVTQALAKLGKAPVGEQDALDAFIREVDGEEWQESSRDTFSAADSAVRSQGVATDGASWFFSWRLGLSRTDEMYNVQASNTAAIPPQLALTGSDHIGDVDVSGGVLYAGIEDSKAYAHPRVGLFDAATLKFQRSFDLPVAAQPDGVPWIAVDGDAQVVYTSHWSPTPAINVWSMQLELLRSIALSPAVSRIQGAKPVRGMLYATSDVTPKEVLKINLETGTVMPLFQIDETNELEGLAWRDGGLHTLDATPSASAIEFRHHARTRPPWRDALCPRNALAR